MGREGFEILIGEGEKREGVEGGREEREEEEKGEVEKEEEEERVWE